MTHTILALTGAHGSVQNKKVPRGGGLHPPDLRLYRFQLAVIERIGAYPARLVAPVLQQLPGHGRHARVVVSAPGIDPAAGVSPALLKTLGQPVQPSTDRSDATPADEIDDDAWHRAHYEPQAAE